MIQLNQIIDSNTREMYASIKNIHMVGANSDMVVSPIFLTKTRRKKENYECKYEYTHLENAQCH